MRPLNIVYVGCGMSGRRTSLAEVLRTSGARVDPLSISGLGPYHVSLLDEGTRIEIAISISAMRAQLFYEDPNTPSLNPAVGREIDLLQDADGILFVIDGQTARMPANLDEFDKLHRDLKSRGIDASTKPTVFQVNKRDLANGFPVEQVYEDFKAQQSAYVESIATEGQGPVKAIRQLVRLIRD